MSIFLETPRLIIEIPTISDVDHQYTLQSNPEVMRYIGKGIRTKKDIEQQITKAIQHYEKYHFSLGSVFEKQTHQFVGRAGLIYLAYDDTQPDIEVAYALLKPFWHQGFATELTRYLIKWGFSNLKIDKLVANTHPDNIASKHVLEKSGMQFIKKGSYNHLPVDYYEILKSNWLNTIS